MRKKFLSILVGSVIVFFGSIGTTPSFADHLAETGFDFQVFSIGELDEFDGCDECSIGDDLDFTVEIDGVEYTSFDMNENGYVQLIPDGGSVENYGYGDIADLIGENDEATYLLAGYDDLFSGPDVYDTESYGFFGYKLTEDQAVFYYDVQTYRDSGLGVDEREMNNFEIILNDDGDVRWNFNYANYNQNSNDLYSGLYLGEDTNELHEIEKYDIPVEESWIHDEGDDGFSFSDYPDVDGGPLDGTGMLGEEIPYEFETFAMSDLDYWQSADDDNSTYDIGDPTELGFEVTLGGATFDRFDMDSNGYIQLLFGDSTDPLEYGLDHIDGLIDGVLTDIDDGDFYDTAYLLAGYDDLSSNYWGFYGFKLEDDRALFYWDTETYDDDEDKLLNNFQIILNEDGSVQWNYKYANYTGYDYDLFSGLYFSNTDEKLKLYEGELPEYESWIYGRVVADESTGAPPTDEPVVPEPASMLLLGSGLLGMVGLRRKNI